MNFVFTFHLQVSSSQPTVVLRDLSTVLSDKDLQILLSKNEVATSLAEDLLAKLSGECRPRFGIGSRPHTGNSNKTVGASRGKEFLHDSDSLKSTLQSSKDLFKIESDGIVNKSEDEKVALDSKVTEDDKDFISKLPWPPSLSINLSSSQLLATCKGPKGNFASNTSIMLELCPPPTPPDPPYPPPTRDLLLPPTPSVFVCIFIC